MKVRIELEPNAESEIVIKCSGLTPDVLRLQKLIEQEMRAGQDGELTLTLGDREYFVSLKDVLFFETSDERTSAHTSESMYYTDMRLFELEEMLPDSFMRISKSGIVNLSRVSSVRRDVTGIGEVFFDGSAKKVFVSRMYYKNFREKLHELRIGSGRDGKS